jgi:TolB-like protein
MSDSSEQDYFADGMAEEIITALSRCSWLQVIARNSSFTYKERIVDVRQIGRELGVRYVLQGSVRRNGNRLRITDQLVDATSGTQIWADRASRPNYGKRYRHHRAEAATRRNRPVEAEASWQS